MSKMKKLIVITPQACADMTVKKLIRLKCVNVTSAKNEEYGNLFDRFCCDAERIEIERKIAAIERALPLMNKHSNRRGTIGDGRKRVDREEFVHGGQAELAYDAVKRMNETVDRAETCRAEIAANEADVHALEPWIDYDVPLSISKSENTVFVLGTFPAQTKLSVIDDALADMLCSAEVISEDKNAVYVSLICIKNDEDDAMRALSSLGFLRASFKDVEKTPREAIEELSAKNNALREEIDECEELMKTYAEAVEDAEILCDIAYTELVAITNKQKLLKSENCAILVGWSPEEKSEKIAEFLGSFDCAYDFCEPAADEEPPVNLRNNAFAQNFEWVVAMYSYPKYGSFDPTFIMSIFYFFIFGLMFADVGYGLILLVAGFLLPKLMGAKKSMKRMLNMFGYCGISSVIMGVIFGGWFGDLPYVIMENFCGIENARELVPFFNGIWFNPLDDPMLFLIVSLAAGGAHIIAGMVVKFIILCKEGRPFSAIFDIGSWWLIFGGIGAIFLPVPKPVAWVLIAVGVLLIVFTHGRNEKNFIMKILKGLLGLYDITSYASDLLSYSRILALGLAAGVVGQVINLIGTMIGPNVIGYIALVLVCLIGHTLNLAINILGSFVHTSRLQYLEFFGKFFEDGGEPFTPEEPSEKYTID